jgi:hypothetical protein
MDTTSLAAGHLRARSETQHASFEHRSGAQTRLLEFYPSLEAIGYARRHAAVELSAVGR